MRGRQPQFFRPPPDETDPATQAMLKNTTMNHEVSGPTIAQARPRRRPQRRGRSRSSGSTNSSATFSSSASYYATEDSRSAQLAISPGPQPAAQPEAAGIARRRLVSHLGFGASLLYQDRQASRSHRWCLRRRPRQKFTRSQPGL